MLRHVRSVLVRAPHVRLRHLRRLDDRIAAHLDGVAVAGAYGASVCQAALERAGAGEVFACAVRALEDHDDAALERLFAIAALLPDAKRGLLSAFGWVSAPVLQGVVRALLASPMPLRREVAIAACRLHRVDPGPALIAALGDPEAGLRTEAARALGELGRTDVLPSLLDALADADAEVAFRAAVAACLLGDRGDALAALEHLAQPGQPLAERARLPWLLACGVDRGHEHVQALGQAAANGAGPAKRQLIRACGWLGDTAAVPWLIDLMGDDVQARIAGEAFSLMTGADLALLDLERKPPANAPNGPNDDPADTDVALDEDESLPWPDAALVRRWWQAQGPTMPAAGARSFMGAPPSAAHGATVLRDATQRQRLVAAQWVCLLAPGTPLFPVCAPSWRQQRLLSCG